MSRALKATYSYVMSEEGTVGTATVTVLALASLVMLVCLISYPEVSDALAIAN